MIAKVGNKTNIQKLCFYLEIVAQRGYCNYNIMHLKCYTKLIQKHTYSYNTNDKILFKKRRQNGWCFAISDLYTCKRRYYY